MPEDTIQSTR